MGMPLAEEDIAIQRATEIPTECRKYISHHVRNGLVSVMGAAMRLKSEPEALDDLEEFIKHIVFDLKKVGL